MTGDIKRPKLPAGELFLFSPRIHTLTKTMAKENFRIMMPGQFHTLSMCSSECWDTTWPSQKPSPHMVQQKEGKGSGGGIFNAGETRRVWKIVEARRTQAVREEKLQELHAT